MKRLLSSAALFAAGIVLAACGSTGSSSYRGPSGTAAAGTPGTVTVRQVDGIGNVLVDSNGKALYSPDEEARGMILCTGACTSFWIPVPAGTGTPTTPAGVAPLGEIDRPDGTKQLTAGGRPLYTFSQDSSGQVTGNGFSDDFSGQHFSWHAVLADGTTTSGSAGTGTVGGSAPDYGYGS
jgi:predicted lipoprotein with Yx(FWY)xxD motif